MPLPLDRVDPSALADAAERARVAHDVSLPELRWLNSEPCAQHDSPQPSCRRCGVVLRRHQRVAVSWLYLKRKGLLADPMGTGKSFSAAGVIAMAAQAGELDSRRGGGRVLVVCRPAALRQWQAELARALPDLASEIAVGSRRQRSSRYAAPWDILLIGHQMLVKDVELLERLGIAHIVVDDVDPVRHHETKTAWAVKRLAHPAQRVMVLNGTPLQKKLEELYDVFLLMGGREVFGSRAAFQRRYVKQEPTTIFTKGGHKKTLQQITGYSRLPEFRERMAPMALRRRLDDLDDLDLPDIVPDNVYLDLYRLQRERYDELAEGVVRILRESGEDIKEATALTKILYGSRICEGLAALDESEVSDGQNSSIKFDWLMDKLTGDWSGESGDDPGEKIVCFVQFKAGIRALQRRLDRAGIGYVTVWGEERDPQIREAAVERFRTDSACRVLLGTSAIEQSLNLQVSRRLVNVDQLMNPARVNQLAGRVRRMGSEHHTVYVHNLLAADTHEERTMAMLESEAALSSYMWQEDDAIYSAVSPLRMLQLIVPDAELPNSAVARAAS